MSNNHPSQSERDRITGYFLPENIDARERLSRSELDEIAAELFGTDNLQRTLTVQGNHQENPDHYVKMKNWNLYEVNYRYSRIFDLCRVIGAVNLYDIGCQMINQSFLLLPYSRMSYTGIMNGKFVLNDYRPSDVTTKNYHLLTADETPQPLCDGRIRYIRGQYPDLDLKVQPENIAVACYSLTMYREEEEIRKMVDALTRDFDRVLFNIAFRDSSVVRFWKNSDWKGFELYPIGPQGFLFATKKPEDIRRLKEFYPFEDGRFLTGIDTAMEHYSCSALSDLYRSYVDWQEEAVTFEDELLQKNKQREKEAFDLAKRKIAELGLDITLISAEYYPEKLTMVLYFRAENRVDLRSLVLEIAGVLRMKTELLQIK